MSIQFIVRNYPSKRLQTMYVSSLQSINVDTQVRQITVLRTKNGNGEVTNQRKITKDSCVPIRSLQKITSCMAIFRHKSTVQGTMQTRQI
jgi:hypothetical protein